MKEILKRLEKAIERSNTADEAWEANPESEAAEKEFDEAYKAEYETRKELATAITKLTKEIDFETAMKMTYNPKLAELIKMTA